MAQSHHHRRYQLHSLRVLFFGIGLIGLCVVKIDATALSPVSTASVLAYATNINRGDLLAYTNSARAANGLGPLALDSRLNTGSQGKAQDMINHDYWSHVSPSGVQPWYWFDWAGYAYQTAGENLAYGFDSSNGVVNGWMNSASHRANILGDYADVGFGIANGENYQGGPNTVVVAHYGKQQVSQPAPAPAPAPTPPAATTTTPSSSGGQPPAAPAEATPAPTPEPAQPVVSEEQEAPKEESPTAPVAASATPRAVSTPKSKNINLIESVSTGTAPMYGIGSLLLLVTSAIGFFFTHRALLHHAWATSEAYVIRHPMVDIAAVGAISILALSTTVSRI